MAEILLGIGGGIAAYKSCDLLRRLQDQGHSVTAVPTPASLNFVGKATWEALSGRPVHSEVWEAVDKVNHVALGESAKYIIVAPATADLIARIANGRADDLLTNSILASNAKKMIVPAMHPKMWLNPATQMNVAKLESIGFVIMPPAVGRLTGSDTGVGRFPDTSAIIEYFNSQVFVKQDLVGTKILITAGGTREAIDEVRFIGNRSSGKQGIALAKSAVARGAEVTLIGANLDLTIDSSFKQIKVTNTAQMQSALNDNFDNCDVLIMAAAVSDVRPKSSSGKIKKEELSQIEVDRTPDLLAEIAKRKRKQIIVGFAAEESQNLESEGRRKLQAKSLDLIYANDIAGGSVFGSDRTKGLIIDAKSSHLHEVTDCTKEELARLLLDRVVERLQSPNV